MGRDVKHGGAGEYDHEEFGKGTHFARPTSEPPLLLSDKDSAKLLGISRATFWRRVADGVFPAPIKIVGRTLWQRDALIATIETLAQSQAESPDDV